MARSRRRRRTLVRGAFGLLLAAIAGLVGWARLEPESFGRVVQAPAASTAGRIAERVPPLPGRTAAPPAWPAIHSKHFFHGCPGGTAASNDLIIRDIYALSSNDGTKLADWVAFRLDRATLGDGREPTERRWEADPWLAEEETLEPDDYRGANAALRVDRGHQAPLASFRGTAEWQQTNHLSNITPQRSDLNQGPWRILEDRERRLVETSGRPVFVMTGPLFEREMPPLPHADEPHRVPSGYWRIVCQDGPNCAAFIFDQDTPRDAAILDHLTTIDDIERRTGLDFLRDLPDAAEDTVEAQSNRAWAEGWAK